MTCATIDVNKAGGWLAREIRRKSLGVDDSRSKNGLPTSVTEPMSLRSKRAVAARSAQVAREAFTKVPGYSTTSPEFREAEAAVAEVKSIDEQIAEVQASQIGVLTTGAPSRPRPGPAS